MILDDFHLDGRVAIVTGAGKGIGAGCARALAEAGADVVCAARTQVDIDAVADDVRKLGRRSLAVATDVTVTEQLENLVARAVEEFGRIDVLVNNAGGSLPRAFMATSERSFEMALRFNVTSAFLLSKLVVPHMVEAGGGRDRQHLVALGEHGAAVLHRVRNREGRAVDDDARDGAGARAEDPRQRDRGRRDRDRSARARARPIATVRAQLEGNTPMQRVGLPADIAAAVVYLSSPASSFVTGKIFEVDGGVEAPAFTIPFERL